MHGQCGIDLDIPLRARPLRAETASRSGGGAKMRPGPSTDAPEPQRAGCVSLPVFETLLESGQGSLKVVSGPQYLEAGSSCKQGMNKVLLRPVPLVAHNPLVRVLVGQEDIVNMNQNPRRKPGHSFQQKEQHVVARFDLVA